MCYNIWCDEKSKNKATAWAHAGPDAGSNTSDGGVPRHGCDLRGPPAPRPPPHPVHGSICPALALAARSTSLLLDSQLPAIRQTQRRAGRRAESTVHGLINAHVSRSPADVVLEGQRPKVGATTLTVRRAVGVGDDVVGCAWLSRVACVRFAQPTELTLWTRVVQPCCTNRNICSLSDLSKPCPLFLFFF